jgi:lambda repressor-like predicted transcriptional regulator
MTTYVARREKAARIRRSKGIPGYLSAHPVIQHIHTLKKRGWTNPEIADTADVDRRTIHNVLHGEVATVHQRTARAILALRPDDAPNRVPAIGTRRRLEALAVMGWPMAHIGAEAGIRGTQVTEIVVGRRKRIPREQAQAVERIFRERALKAGPSKRTRTIALRNGWVTALAWDDIDNPDEKPQGLKRRRTRAAA